MIANTFRFRFGAIKELLKERVSQALSPVSLDIEDESKYHSRGIETHFKMVIVSDRFQNLSRLEKQRLVYSSLGEVMGKIHALTLTCLSPEEAEGGKAENESPGCMHGQPKGRK